MTNAGWLANCTKTSTLTSAALWGLPMLAVLLLFRSWTPVDRLVWGMIAAAAAQFTWALVSYLRRR